MNKLYEEQSVQAIADAIRAKNGSSDTYTISEMATAISNIQTGIPNMKFAYNNMSFINENAPKLDTSNYRDMSYMFAEIQDGGLDKTLDLSSWDVSNVNNMSFMFNKNNGAQPFTSIDITGWDTSKVEDAVYMFNNCRNLTQISGIEDLDVSSLRRMNNMFCLCYAITSLDLSGWRPDFTYTDGLTNTFADCHALTSLDVSGWDVSNCTSLSGTFWNTPLLTTIDLSSWDMTPTNLQYAFSGCTSLQTLRLDNIDLSNVSSYGNAFTNVPTTCNIYVKNQASKDWMTNNFPSMTNVVIA